MNFLRVLLNKLPLLYLVFFCSAFASADMHTTVITLEHQPAQQLIPVITPLLPPTSAISGDNMQLIIKTTDAALKDITPVIKKLDKHRTDLMISVRRSQHPDDAINPVALHHATVISTKKHNQHDSMQQVRVQEGAKAFIQTNTSYPQDDYFFTLWGAGRDLEYTDIKTGYILSATLNNNQAIVDIQYQFARMNDDRNPSLQQHSPITVEKTATQLTIPLGQWFSLSQLSSHELETSHKTVYDTSDLKQPDAQLYIKIDRAFGRVNLD